MRRYLRPLVIVFSSLALAFLVSYVAIELTEPAPKVAAPEERPATPEAQAKATFLKAKAEAADGAPKHLYVLATLHLVGLGTEQDEAEAARLYGIAAKKDDAEAQLAFGKMLLQGVGVKKDTAAGLDWLRKSAARGHAEAEYQLYLTYHEGELAPADAQEARRWLMLAANHGQPDARAVMAEEIIKSQDASRAKAVANWVRAGAMRGHPQSCHVMSFVYKVGMGVKTDLVESLAWHLVMLNADKECDPEQYREDYEALRPAEQAAAEKRAKELSGQREYRSPFARSQAELAAKRQAYEEAKHKAEAGDTAAMHKLSRMLCDGDGISADVDEAVRWLRRAADQGHADSQYDLGTHLMKGEGIAPDPKEAYAWFMKAAAQGHAWGERAVGISLIEGKGVKQQVEEGRQWILKAAEHGQPNAQNDVGKWHLEQTPDAARDAIAVRWFRKSAEQLDTQGILSLAHCYQLGRGVAKDPIEAFAWLTIGYNRFSPQLRAYVQKLADDFTEEELEKATKRGKAIKDECRDKFMASLAAKQK